MELLSYIVLVGLGATALMDGWALLRRRAWGIPPPNHALVGRWVAHVARGRFRHDAIARSPAVRAEAVLGWTTHYLVGIGFAALLPAVAGTAWFARPTFVPALLLGIGTVLAPFLVMQPGMGAGIAASRTPRPGAARLQSLLNHAVYGVGLFLGGQLAVKLLG